MLSYSASCENYQTLMYNKVFEQAIVNRKEREGSDEKIFHHAIIVEARSKDGNLSCMTFAYSVLNEKGS